MSLELGHLVSIFLFRCLIVLPVRCVPVCRNVEIFLRLLEPPTYDSLTHIQMHFSVWFLRDYLHWNFLGKSRGGAGNGSRPWLSLTLLARYDRRVSVDSVSMTLMLGGCCLKLTVAGAREAFRCIFMHNGWGLHKLLENLAEAT